MLTDGEAMQVAKAILGIEPLDCIVDCQFDANETLGKLIPDMTDREKVVEAARQIGQQLFEDAGDWPNRIAP
jgi:hypothetical protein